MTSSEDRVLKIARELAKAYPITLSTARELAQTALELNALNTLQRVRELHAPVEIEPSDTICRECSYQLPNGKYFGKLVEYPCPTIQALNEKGTSK